MRILQLNDRNKTHIDFSVRRIRHFKWHNQYYIKLVFDSGEVETFVYDTAKQCREDYTMLIDLEWMISNRVIMHYPIKNEKQPYI